MNAKIRLALDELKAKSRTGKLMPREVIASARSPKSPLHDSFTWNQKEGFEKNLMREAQTLIASYSIVVYHGDSAIKTRNFVSLTIDRKSGGGYRTIAEVLDEEALTQVMLADALGELASFQAKYRRLTQLSGVMVEIDKAREKHGNRAPKESGRRKAA